MKTEIIHMRYAGSFLDVTRFGGDFRNIAKSVGSYKMPLLDLRREVSMFTNRERYGYGFMRDVQIAFSGVRCIIVGGPLKISNGKHFLTLKRSICMVGASVMWDWSLTFEPQSTKLNRYYPDRTCLLIPSWVAEMRFGRKDEQSKKFTESCQSKFIEL